MSASTKTGYKSAAGTVYVDALSAQIYGVQNQLLRLPKFGAEIEPMTATQGGYRPCTPYSGCTHTGCAVCDFTAYNWKNRLVTGDLLGLIVCHRLVSEGDWPEHNHTMTNGMGCASKALQGQIQELMAGGDGLVGSRLDRDAKLRSGLWPLAIYKGRTGPLVATANTHLYDGPSSSRKVLAATPRGSQVTALMEVRVPASDHVWFVTDQGMWGFSGKWERVPVLTRLFSR